MLWPRAVVHDRFQAILLRKAGGYPLGQIDLYAAAYSF